MIDLINDISKLTTIREDDLNKLVNKAIWCICNAINESELNHDNITEINIGIGKLIITSEDDMIKYNFIPSKKLEKYLIKTITENKNPLKLMLEKTLCSRITNAYKDIF